MSITKTEYYTWVPKKAGGGRRGGGLMYSTEYKNITKKKDTQA
jgi:hypothetical protein